MITRKCKSKILKLEIKWSLAKHCAAYHPIQFFSIQIKGLSKIFNAADYINFFFHQPYTI